MVFDNLLLERDGAVASITINRPKVLNALNTQTLDELRRAILDLKQDAGMRVVILTGAGEKAFVAGGGHNGRAGGEPDTRRGDAAPRPHPVPLMWDIGK